MPGSHPALQIARNPVDPDGHRQLRRAGGVGVVLADEHDLLIATGDPRELGAEAGPHHGIADRAGDVGRVVVVVVRTSTTSAPADCFAPPHPRPAPTDRSRQFAAAPG